jgi:hypothetical protein
MIPTPPGEHFIHSITYHILYLSYLGRRRAWPRLSPGCGRGRDSSPDRGGDSASDRGRNAAFGCSHYKGCSAEYDEKSK